MNSKSSFLRSPIGLLLLLAVLVGVLLPPPLRAGEPVVLKVFSLPDPKATDPFTQASRAVLDRFREKYPWIELRQFSGIRVEGMAMDAGPLMAIAGGVSPDIIYVNFRQSDTYIQNRFLYPMDEFLKDIPQEVQNLRVAKPVWPVIKRKGPDNEVHVWAMPYSTVVATLVYRKDLFLRVGLDPEKPPRTWEEHYEYCRKLTIPEEGTYGTIAYKGAHAAYGWFNYLVSAGAEAVKQNPDSSWYAAFNSEEAVIAMDYYVRLITEKWKDASGNDQMGYVLRESSDISKAWEEGRLGMRFTYMDDKSLGRQTDPNLYGLAPMPKGPTGESHSEVNCLMMGIFSGAGLTNNAGMGDRDRQAVLDAAWKYIWFIDSEEARKIRMEVMIEAGYGKMQNPILLKRYGYEEYLKYVQPGWLETFEYALENGTPEPYGRNCQMVYNFMTTPLDQCIALGEEGELGEYGTSARRQKIRTILDEAVKRTNEEMIGHIPPEVRTHRNRVAFVVAIFIAIVFFLVLRKIWKIFTPEQTLEDKGWMLKKYYVAYLLLIPGLGSILLWKYVPMFMGSVIAFQDYSVVADSQWVGLQNFADVIYDPRWWSALSKTLYYMVLFLCFAFWPPIILAILLQEVSHGKVIYRTIYYLPAVITGVIVIYLWKLLYDPSEAGGLNQIIMALGIEKQRWIDDEKLAMICCVLPMVWAGMGPGCLIYLAALKGIPDDSYEAADIDGANFFQKILPIVFPNLKALVIIQLIQAFIASSQQTGFILIMTYGGPNEATLVAGLTIWQKAYVFLKFGIATTMAWMLGIMLIGFTVIQLRKLSRMEFRAAGTQDANK